MVANLVVLKDMSVVAMVSLLAAEKIVALLAVLVAVKERQRVIDAGDSECEDHVDVMSAIDDQAGCNSGKCDSFGGGSILETGDRRGLLSPSESLKSFPSHHFLAALKVRFAGS
jgi:hypothetical protein